MLAAQSPPGTAESQTRYYGTDQETHQIHIQVGTDTIARIRQPDTVGLVHLKQLLNTHDEMPAHLRGCINLEREECDLQGDSVRRSDEATAKDPYALDWYFSATCKAHKSPTKAAKFKVGGPHKNNGMLTLQFRSEICDHTSEEARTLHRKGASTAKRKRSGRIAAARTRTSTTAEPQVSSCSPLCSPKLEDTDPPGANRVLDTTGKGGISTGSFTKENRVSTTPLIASRGALADQPNHSIGTVCRDFEVNVQDGSPEPSGMAKRTRRARRAESENATHKKRSTRSADRMRRGGSTHRSVRHSSLRSTRSTTQSSRQRDDLFVSRQPTPCVQVVIPSFSRVVKPEPSQDHDDLSSGAPSVPSPASDSRLDTPARSTDTPVEAISNDSTDPSKEEVLKASDLSTTAPAPPFSSDNTDSTIVKKEVSDDTALPQTSDNEHRHQAADSQKTIQHSTALKPPLENRTTCTSNSSGPSQPCRTMDTSKRQSNLQQQSSTGDYFEKEHDQSTLEQPHTGNKYASRPAAPSAQPATEGHDSKQGGLLTPTPSLSSFEAAAQGPSSTSILPFSVIGTQSTSTKPQPPPQSCTGAMTPSGSGRLCAVSLRSPKRWLTQVPIAISPATTFEDLLQYVIQEIEGSIQLPLGMRWAIRSQDLSQQYLLHARVAETISGVEHAELVIMTERRAALRLEDF